MPRAALTLSLLAAACAGGSSPAAPAPAPPLPERVILRIGEVTGLSALAADPAGGLWTAPERDRVLVALEPDGRARRVPLAGIPTGLDVESASWLDRDRIALGTEANLLANGTPLDQGGLIFIARQGSAGFEVEGVIELDYRLWDLRVRSNEGIEGLCTAAGALYLGIETVAGAASSRSAPLARYDLTTGDWTGYLLRLTSSTGSLSALACRERAGLVEGIAVERHFGVSRLLQFTFPPDGGIIEPRVLLDLAAFVAETSVNLEGIELIGDDIVLVVDNDYRTVTGPNELVFLRR